MKLLLFLVSAATMASVTHATPGLVRQLIERHVQSNVDLQTMMNFQSSDWTCMMKGAMDETSCEDDVDNNCSWCPLGTIMGACVSTEQADAVNGLEIPHFQCGAPSTASDMDFWDSLVGCELQGATSMDCLSNPACTWCVVQEPAFGLCMSQESIDVASTMLVQAQEEEEAQEEPIIEMEDVLQCRQEPPQDSDVTGLLDMNCILEGVDQQGCQEGVDGAGNLCVWQDSDLFGALCLSATQTNVMKFLMDTIDSLDLDIDSIMNGDVDTDMSDMMLGGDVEIDVIPQLYGDYPDPNEEGDYPDPNYYPDPNEEAVLISSSTNGDQSSSGDDFDQSQDEMAYPEEVKYDYEAGLPITSSNVNEAAPSEKNEDEDAESAEGANGNGNGAAPSEENEYDEDAQGEDEEVQAVSEEYKIETEPFETEMESVEEEEPLEDEEPEPPTTHHQPEALPKETKTKPSLAQSILASAARDATVQEQTKHNGGDRRA